MRTMVVTILFALIQLIDHLHAIAIDNSVSDNPEVQCGSDSISIVFKTLKPFGGRTFVKGYIQDSECVQAGNKRYEHRFSIRFDQCGLRRAREYNGVSISTTVIVSFHHIFLTKVDRAYRLNCFYMEVSKTVSQQIEVSMMTTTELRAQTQMPVCRYEIVAGGPDGAPVRYAKIGDSVYHKWTCVSELDDVYCMRVHTCTVYDGQGGERVEVLDARGCSVDKFVLLDLDYVTDLSAGQEAHVFKFADRPALYFNCQLELTLKDRAIGCTKTQPRCGPQVEVQPSAQTYEQSATDNEFSPTAPAPNYQQTDAYPNEAYLAEAQSNYGSTTQRKIYPSAAPPGINPPAGGVDEEYPSTVHEINYSSRPTAPYDDGVPYRRLIRKRRNISDTGARTHVADVDLPEQTLTVFGIEDGPPPTQQEFETNSVEGIDVVDRARTCFTNASVVLSSAAVVSVFILLTSMLMFVIRRQRQMLNAQFSK